MNGKIDWLRGRLIANFKAWRTSGISNVTERCARAVNVITGYNVCERLRESVRQHDTGLSRLKSDLTEARIRYRRAVAERSACQKEINGLLQRKSGWQDAELTRFTELYRREMQLEQDEFESKAENEVLEKKVDQAHQDLINAMRERYQEEQLWSDKIRRTSTFGTFGLMFVNFLLFFVLQVYIEPRKRRRLVNEVISAMEEHRK
jgi:sensitive to high expression protein 9